MGAVGVRRRAQTQQMEGEWLPEIKMWSGMIRSCLEHLKCFKEKKQGATERVGTWVG